MSSAFPDRPKTLKPSEPIRPPMTPSPFRRRNEKDAPREKRFLVDVINFEAQQPGDGARMLVAEHPEEKYVDVELLSPVDSFTVTSSQTWYRGPASNRAVPSSEATYSETKHAGNQRWIAVRTDVLVPDDDPTFPVVYPVVELR